MLRQLENLFIIKLKILKFVLNKDYFAKIDIKYLLSYFQIYIDFKSAEINTLLKVIVKINSEERNFNNKVRARLATIGLNINIRLEDIVLSRKKWMTLA